MSLLFFVVSSFAQEYSTDQLIGNSGIDLVGDNYKLLPQVEVAFLQMQKAALEDGIQIKIVSSYRSFERQKVIWNKKYKRYISQGLTPKESIKKIIEYSTIPGTSRHHWGTDIDIIDDFPNIKTNVLDPNKFNIGGPYYKLKKWLEKNANNYDFYMVYTNDKYRKGFKYEPWHYSYKSISKPMLQEFLKVDFVELFKNEDILGKEYFDESFLNNYLCQHILDINKKLK